MLPVAHAVTFPAHTTTPLLHNSQPPQSPTLPAFLLSLFACCVHRIAARKCRAKKNALMTDLQATLAGLVRKNEEYKLQVRPSGPAGSRQRHAGDHRAVLRECCGCDSTL